MAFLDWLTSVAQARSPIAASSTTLRSRLLKDPYYRLQSLEEVQLAVSLGIKIDANQATVDDWLRLPGISIHQARSLAELTQSGVQFCALEDVAAVLGVSVSRLQPVAPILSFCYYDAASLVTIEQVNPNTASVEALLKVPPIDLFLARAIVQNRLVVGPYRSLADLQRRLALPSAVTTDLMHYLRF
uniref:ComEA family DNA-binding protein n=1 Tax=Trichocoleus desertorum TaxID=1481672 RepID=UPI0025B623BD|nr:ComEA family DNA-binding protein [Trichocoleus desertorum]